MKIHIRIERWVLWWICIGVVCGVVAIINILGHNLTRTQEDMVLVIGVFNWVLGGLICYAFDAIGVEQPSRQPKDKEKEPPRAPEFPEPHPGSDFVFPGGRKSLLPPRYW